MYNRCILQIRMVDDSVIHSLPLSSLPYRTLRLIECLLNPKKVIPSDVPNMLPRDWRGLAFLVNISSEMESYIQQFPNETGKVLELWQKNGVAPTVGDLLKHLEVLDRYDVYDDVIDDLREALRTKEISVDVHNQIVVRNNNYNGVSTESNIEQITYDDRPGYAHIYDAIVLYAEDDKSFVAEMLRRMAEDGFQICTVDDLQVGHTTQYAPVAQLISERCRLVILVFSPEFLNSTGMSFFTDYAQADSIESAKRKMIPIVYRDCNLPRHLAHYHKLFYHSQGRPMYNFWHKLKQSLEAGRMVNSIQQHRQLTNGSSATIEQVNIHEIPAEKPRSISTDSEDNLFLKNVETVSRSPLNSQIVTLESSEESKSLSDASQISGNSETKKKKKSVFHKISLPFSKKKSKKAIMVAN